MLKSTIGVPALACWLLAGAAGALAQEGASAPGQFDFYILSLSWSPSFCAEAAERHGDGAGGAQCGPRPYSFVVHGLWPQYDKGYPQYCRVPAPRLYHGIVDSMLDLMPARHLIYNEWDKHGTCSGLSPADYFATVRKARGAVQIPPQFSNLAAPLSVTPKQVEDAFIKANPGLSADAMAVMCDKRRLTEIRLCLSKDLKFRGCAAVAAHSCRRAPLLMPPVRGG